MQPPFPPSTLPPSAPKWPCLPQGAPRFADKIGRGRGGRREEGRGWGGRREEGRGRGERERRIRQPGETKERAG